MLDRPGLVLIVLLATFGPAAGFALKRYFGGGFDAWWTMFVIDAGTGYTIFMYVASLFEDYKRIGEAPVQRPAYRNEPLRIPDLSYDQTVTAVHFDPRRLFAVTILRQYEHGFDVKLTEAYWLKKTVTAKGKAARKRWQGTPDEFRVMMHEWDGVIFERKDPTRENSPYIVRDVARLRSAAEGKL